MVTVKELSSAEYARWNEFVLGHSDGSIFHRAEWLDIFAGALGHTPHYFFAERSGDIVGVLPSIEIKSRLFGHSLISLPFLAYGGTLSSDAAAEIELEERLTERGNSLGVDFIELRDRERVRDDWLQKSQYVTFRKAIPESSDECLKMIPRKQRAMIRKGIANDLRGRVDDSIEDFYAILSESYRNLGTPVLPKRYFESIRRSLGDSCEVLTITKDDQPVASVMSYYHKDEVIPYYGGSRNVARNLKANDFMYWELMRSACERGVKIFDYGRSRAGTGSYRFKRHWGFEPEPLRYQYRLVRQSAMPNVSPDNPKYELAIRLWQKLPVRVTQVIGPFIARGLPG